MENENMSIEERIAETVEYYKENRQAIWVRMGGGSDVLDMARGGNANGIREQYYQGWTDQDFKKVWVAMGECPDEI